MHILSMSYIESPPTPSPSIQRVLKLGNGLIVGTHHPHPPQFHNPRLHNHHLHQSHGHKFLNYDVLSVPDGCFNLSKQCRP